MVLADVANSYSRQHAAFGSAIGPADAATKRPTDDNADTGERRTRGERQRPYVQWQWRRRRAAAVAAAVWSLRHCWATGTTHMRRPCKRASPPPRSPGRRAGAPAPVSKQARIRRPPDLPGRGNLDDYSLSIQLHCIIWRRSDNNSGSSRNGATTSSRMNFSRSEENVTVYLFADVQLKSYTKNISKQ